MSRSGPSSASPMPWSQAIRSPASTARKGRRVANSGGSVLERAEKWAAAKALPTPGIHPTHAVDSSPVRLALPTLSDNHLFKIMSDVGVVVDSNVGSPTSLLAIIRANEAAQAAIAKAKEAVASEATVSIGPLGPEAGLGVGSGQPQPGPSRRGTSKRVKTCATPSRSSLRIKNFSYK